ncbi:MAG: tetratricopeptide repeat protein, partial [Cyanobacteriota bacterium]
MAPSPGDWYRKGEAALEAGRSQEAEEALWRCLAEQPEHGGALHLLGRLRQQQGRLEDAIRLQRSSVRWDPGLGWNSFALAELLEQRQQWQEACGALAAAAAQLPGEPWIARRRQRLEGLAALGGERLRQGLGPASYRYWCQELEPPLPAAEPGLDPLPGWLVLSAADAVLRPGALAWIAAELQRRAAAGEPPPDGFYADEDLLSPQGERHSPWFKPGWQPETFWSTPWLEGLSGWRRDWLQRAGLPPPPPAAAAADRFSWQLRALESGPRLLALPRLLVHRRELSAALDPAAPAAALEEARVRAGMLQQHLLRLGEAVSAVTPEGLPEGAAPEGCFGFRLQWALPAAAPLVRVIVPSRDRPDLLAACLGGLAASLESRQPLGSAAALGVELELEVMDNG